LDLTHTPSPSELKRVRAGAARPRCPAAKTSKLAKLARLYMCGMSNISALLLVALAVAVAADAQPRPWMNKADPPAVRAQKLLSQMTLDEKIVMLHGPIDPMPCCECDEAKGPLCNYTGNVYPNARLGIPQARLGAHFLSLIPHSACSLMKRFHRLLPLLPPLPLFTHRSR
jgi:hypothetical protein